MVVKSPWLYPTVRGTAAPISPASPDQLRGPRFGLEHAAPAAPIAAALASLLIATSVPLTSGYVNPVIDAAVLGARGAVNAVGNYRLANGQLMSEKVGDVLHTPVALVDAGRAATKYAANYRLANGQLVSEKVGDVLNAPFALSAYVDDLDLDARLRAQARSIMTITAADVAADTRASIAAVSARLSAVQVAPPRLSVPVPSSLPTLSLPTPDESMLPQLAEPPPLEAIDAPAVVPEAVPELDATDAAIGPLALQADEAPADEAAPIEAAAIADATSAVPQRTTVAAVRRPFPWSVVGGVVAITATGSASVALTQNLMRAAVRDFGKTNIDPRPTTEAAAPPAPPPAVTTAVAAASSPPPQEELEAALAAKVAEEAAEEAAVRAAEEAAVMAAEEAAKAAEEALAELKAANEAAAKAAEEAAAKAAEEAAAEVAANAAEEAAVMLTAEEEAAKFEADSELFAAAQQVLKEGMAVPPLELPSKGAAGSARRAKAKAKRSPSKAQPAAGGATKARKTEAKKKRGSRKA